MTLEKFGEEVEPPPSSCDYMWQLKNSITTLKELQSHIPIESNYIETGIPLRITPYYLKILKQCPSLLKTMIPYKSEFDGIIDPLHEEEQTKIKGLVHRYPDRVLLLVTDFCFANCQFCTRSRMINKNHMSLDQINDGIEYIKKHKEIRDVLISGGDPLTLDDDILENIIKKIKAIEHVEIIRVGTKSLAVNPFRITNKLVSMLAFYSPIFINMHFTHPAEITYECKAALNKLADHGIILGAQTVLLQQINNDAKILKKLFQQLVMNRVIPRYLYNCDQIPGYRNFRVPLKDGIQIMRDLQGHTSGMCVPKFIVDSGEGKIPIDLGYTVEQNGDHYKFLSYNNKIVNFIDN